MKSLLIFRHRDFKIGHKSLKLSLSGDKHTKQNGFHFQSKKEKMPNYNK